MTTNNNNNGYAGGGGGDHMGSSGNSYMGSSGISYMGSGPDGAVSNELLLYNISLLTSYPIAHYSQLLYENDILRKQIWRFQ